VDCRLHRRRRSQKSAWRDGFAPVVGLPLGRGRVNGRYRFTMEPPGGEPFHLSGTFLAVDPPRRLVYTFNWEEPTPDDRETVVTLALDAHDGGTRVSLSQGLFATEERLALHRDGWTESFEKLREVLGTRG
jgi:uncharacterized protein YndB with AHSA1/START domain